MSHPTSPDVTIEQLGERTAEVLKRVAAGERIRVIDERGGVVSRNGYHGDAAIACGA
jgi:hypothetical protein